MYLNLDISPSHRQSTLRAFLHLKKYLHLSLWLYSRVNIVLLFHLMPEDVRAPLQRARPPPAGLAEGLRREEPVEVGGA